MGESLTKVDQTVWGMGQHSTFTEMHQSILETMSGSVELRNEQPCTDPRVAPRVSMSLFPSPIDTKNGIGVWRRHVSWAGEFFSPEPAWLYHTSTIPLSVLSLVPSARVCVLLRNGCLWWQDQCESETVALSLCYSFARRPGRLCTLPMT